MQHCIKTILTALVVSMCLIASGLAARYEVAPRLAAPYENGLSAYNSGDYAKAVAWFRKAANQGDATAVVWFREAAEQGISDAQGLPGLMHSTGRGVPQDYVEAFKWLNLAAAQGNNMARQAREFTARKLTPAQIVEAERLARHCKPKK